MASVTTIERISDYHPAPVLLTLLLAATAAATPPTLREPAAARAYAQSDALPAMTRAETLLFARDPHGALDALLATDVPRDDPRRIRLELDAFVALGRTRLAQDRAEHLGAAPGWLAHAQRQTSFLDEAVMRRDIVRVALALFATCLAALGLAGARELLRPGVETAVLIGAVVVAAGLFWLGSGALAALITLPGLATVALVHAASAAVRRTAATVRGRMLAVVLVLLGTGGAFAAVLVQIGPYQVLDLLAG